MASLTRLATCGVLSIGEMGLGIARLLIANDFHVITNASDRSPATNHRARSNAITLVPTDADLVAQSDYILSIVPPRDALATARRIAAAATADTTPTRTRPLYFVDLNAISPVSARQIATLFPSSSPVRYIDGGIIGAPPSQQADGTWKRPSIPVSGPHTLADAQPAGAPLAAALNAKHISATIGSATGLKMCFASLTKGHTALAIQAFSTAQRMGVLEELKEAMGEFNAAGLAHAERSLPGMCPKAYRWVEEMRQIGGTFAVEGGWEGENVFSAVAEVFGFVAEETELGGEKVDGRTAEDVAVAVGRGLARRKEKVE